MADPVGDLLAQNPPKKCDLPNGETLNYRELNKGEKHKLVFLPGYAADADSWAALLAVRPEFADHHIIAVNPRGYNGSTNNKSAYSHEENADDVKLLLDQIGIEKTMVMGSSTGGGPAAWLAIKYPEKITAGFMMDSIPLDGLRVTQLTEEGAPSDKPILTRDDAVTQVDVVNNLGVFSGSIERFHSFVSTYCAIEKALPPPDSPIMHRWHQGALAHTSRVEALVANAWFNVTPIKTPRSPPSMALKDLKVPLIVIHGECDQTCDRAQAKAVTELAIAEKWAPKGKISYYEHPGGHLGFFEDPDEYCSVYLKALKEQVLVDGMDTNAKQHVAQ